MNASLPPLPRTIEFIRDLLRDDPNTWPKYARLVDGLPRVTISEAGDAAAMVASSARALVRQLHRLTPEAAAELRPALHHLTDSLQVELNTNGAKPYHIEKG